MQNTQIYQALTKMAVPGLDVDKSARENAVKELDVRKFTVNFKDAGYQVSFSCPAATIIEAIEKACKELNFAIDYVISAFEQ